MSTNSALRAAHSALEAKPTRWNCVPSEPRPLRETLPAISTRTRERLIAWALRQPAVMPWLLKRTAAYFEREAGSGECGTGASDELHQQIDATAALDLLEWQSDCRGKEAIGRLEAFEEVAGLAEPTEDGKTGQGENGSAGPSSRPPVFPSSATHSSPC